MRVRKGSLNLTNMKFKVAVVHYPRVPRVIRGIHFINDKDNWMLIEYKDSDNKRIVYADGDATCQPSLDEALELIKPKDVIYK